MLNDITFGQYFPTNSLIHKLDPRIKFVLMILTIVFVFLSSGLYTMSLSLLFCFTVIIMTKIPIKVYLKNLKVILPILIITGIINIFYIKTGTELLSLGFTKIYSGGLIKAGFLSLRIALLILISSTLTYTTTPNDLTDAIERLCKPLKYIGLGTVVHVLTMMMTIALRFIPTLIEETQKIMNAQKARGADIESGGLFSRIKALIPILIPLIILSVRRAYDLAEAMECRCYNGGVGRKRMKQLHIKFRDIISLFVTLIWCGSIIVLKIFVG